MRNTKWLAGIFLALSILFLPQAALADDVPVTSPFGWRLHPISGEWKFHAGVDLGYDYGTPVTAVFSGQVVQSGDFGDGYGNQILLYHPDIDSYTRYGHMSGLSVTAGDWVNAGDVIGWVGSTGYSTGPHLHLEYIIPDGNGGYTYTDPLALWEM